MSGDLLQTKLYVPPLRPRLVPRPQLIEKLNLGLHQGCKLTIISAPAGFGKTTIVCEWVRSLRQAAAGADQIVFRTAWLSLDEGDNDPARFLAYLIAALDRVEGIETMIGKGALAMLQSAQPPPAEDILTSLINDMTVIPDRVILILDDYHAIDSPPVDAALSFLLEHLPSQMHLVIATRDDPHLPLARLRARGQMNELRAADLRFSAIEVVEFLNQVMCLNLSLEDVAALESRTEGWIAGLQLAAISMQGQEDAAGLIKSFSGSHRFVLDYLMEEVLEQQSKSVQTFLLHTAVLKRMTGSLCDAVRFVIVESDGRDEGTRDTGQENGQAILERLEHANLFIVPLDEERHWYRYHHLFAELLQQRLRQKQSDLIPTLHQRARRWYEQNGFVDEAIESGLRAEEFERAAQLIAQQVDALWQRGEHTKMRRWLFALPEELIFTKPHLCIFHAWYLFSSGRQDAGERSLQAVDKALEPSLDPVAESSALEQSDRQSDPERAKLRGRAAVIRASMASYRGDVPEIIQQARLALDSLPEQDIAMRSAAAITLGNAYGFSGDMKAAYQARLEAVEASKSGGNTYFSIVAHLEVAITLREQGRLRRTIEICRQQVQLADNSGLSQASVTGCLMAIWGEALAEQGDLVEAKRQTIKGVARTAGGDVAMLGWSTFCLMRVLFSTREMAAAQETVQKLERIAREADVPPWITNQMAAWQARLWLEQDNLEAVSTWTVERRLITGDWTKTQPEIDYFSLFDYLILARLRIAQGRLDEAIELLRLLLEPAETGGRTTRMIEILLLQAMALQAAADTSAALIPLERALTLAEPEGFSRIFVDEGPPMAQMLHEAAAQGIMPAYTQRLRAEFQKDVPEQPGRSKYQAANSGLVETLSEREIEVLQLIAEGLTNQEIANRLFLSLNTIKVHTRNIYGKLDAHNRTQAIARANALGILPSI